MSFIARAVSRPSFRPAAVRVLKRGYAEAVSADKIKLSLALPENTIYENTEVNLPTSAGDIGILANHVPMVQQLRPGMVEVTESNGNTKQYFIAGGFATVNEGSTLAINAIDAFPVEDFAPETIRKLLADAQKNASSSNEAVATEAKIEVEVLEALAAATK